LISDALQSEERVREWLEKAKIGKEKIDKIFEFAQKYLDLKDDIRVVHFETLFEFINPLT
jgi:hypothetical protein